jgi:hypothetical protein
MRIVFTLLVALVLSAAAYGQQRDSAPTKDKASPSKCPTCVASKDKAPPTKCATCTSQKSVVPANRCVKKTRFVQRFRFSCFRGRCR